MSTKTPNELQEPSLDDMLEGMFAEVEKQKAARKKAGVAVEAQTVETQPWVESAIVGVFAACTCKNCGDTTIVPHSKEPLVRYVHKRQPNTIWETSTPIGIIPKGLPRIRKIIPTECDYCITCFELSQALGYDS